MRSSTFPASLFVALSVGIGAHAAEYSSPQDAGEALAAALATGDPAQVAGALGPDAEDLAGATEIELDAAAFAVLHAAWREGYRFVPNDNGGVVLELGSDGWPFPVPLTRDGDVWTFDIAAGRDEIEAREIGRNELDVIDLLQLYVAVQALYRLEDHDGDGVMEFASSIISPPGARSGLYWIGRDSPVGDRIARASLDGFLEPGAIEVTHEPFFGYYFRVLTEQTDAAPGGAMSYVIGGNMVGGHAILAVPADYGVTGIHSFLVNEAGSVWEADLGDSTLDVAFNLEALDPAPGAGWEEISIDVER